ncbi:PREDICTED: shugoshin-like 2 [Cyprinodon variegatus]|uniref:shugoshin-like 2 n=1 Tax=Cyprinodon variegatus TaxID=28743 RepID=UPI000742C69D|nr:PREDICTED: shugoshin-like 2 [Cyprinodon variegatus]XP_015224890.1 PREDICTED: shugoshin-like 2 [Cyprinodon variegatus]
MMLPMKTMTPLKLSKQNSVLASKIKNKILNTSSFFKVSLKTNNKALALALQAQKERSRQLEMQVMDLQKQVDTLCFKLATNKYKHRKLLLILKDFHSNTLQHLDMVEELVSDQDSPRVSDGSDTSTHETQEKDAASWRNAQLVLQPEISRISLRPNKNSEARARVLEKNGSEDVSGVLSKTPDLLYGNKDAENFASLSCRVEAPPPAACRPSSSSSLRSEVERLSRAFSQPSLENNAVLCPQNNPTWINSPSVSGDINVPSGSALEDEPQFKQPDNTVLLSTSMEITLTKAAEIITVESKANARSPQERGSATDVQKGLNQTSPAKISTQVSEQPAGDKDPDIPTHQLTKKLLRNGKTSRIPKLGNQQKASTDSCDPAKKQVDDYFSDHKVISSKDGGDESREGSAGFNVTYRRSKSKVKRRSAAVKNSPSASVLLSSHDDNQSRQSRLETVQNEEEAERGEPLHGCGFYLEEVGCSELVENQPPDNGREKQNKRRCRGTFVISVCRDSSSLPDVDHDPILPAGLRCDAQGAPDAAAPSAEPETSRSSKRPLGEISENNPKALQADQHGCSSSEYRKPKKPRREEEEGSRKKKSAEVSDDKKKTKKSSREVSSDVEPVPDPACRADPSFYRLYSSDMWRGEEDFQMLPSQEKDISEDLHDPKLSKSTTDCKPQRKTKPHAATKARNPREKPARCRRTTTGNSKGSSLSGKRTSIVTEERARQNVEDLLMDIPPPWLFEDISIVSAESDSLPSSPARSLSSRSVVSEELTEASSGGFPLYCMWVTASLSQSVDLNTPLIYSFLISMSL